MVCDNELLCIVWNLIIVNGLLVVHFINLETHVCGVMETSGKIPVTHILPIFLNFFLNFAFLYALPTFFYVSSFKLSILCYMFLPGRTWGSFCDTGRF